MLLSRLVLTLWLGAVPLLAYPVYGTKRYGRSSGPKVPHLSWGMVPVAPQHHYYHGVPLDYQDYYYQPGPYFPPESYSPLPYYYDPEPARQHPAYGYYSYDDEMVPGDPIEDIEEEIQHEAEREEREEALPIGQETWFEHPGGSSRSREDVTADVNSVFLQNLILSQLYSDDQQRQRAAAAAALYPALQQGPQYFMPPQVATASGPFPAHPQQQQVRYGIPYLLERDSGEEPAADDAGAWEETSSARQYPYGTVEEDELPPQQPRAFGGYDEDVMELKSLVKKARQQPEFVAELGPWFEGGMHFSDRKTPVASAVTSTAVPQEVATTQKPAIEATTAAMTSTVRPAFDDKRRGMKEVAVPRPPAPLRRPFETRGGSNTSRPSVYDTIKQLLSMEASLQDQQEPRRSAPQKRFVSNEEALVEQLGGLQKKLSE